MRTSISPEGRSVGAWKLCGRRPPPLCAPTSSGPLLHQMRPGEVDLDHTSASGQRQPDPPVAEAGAAGLVGPNQVREPRIGCERLDVHDLTTPRAPTREGAEVKLSYGKSATVGSGTEYRAGEQTRGPDQRTSASRIQADVRSSRSTVSVETLSDKDRTAASTSTSAAPHPDPPGALCAVTLATSRGTALSVSTRHR